MLNYDIFGNPIQQQAETAQSIQQQALLNRARLARARARELVLKYNRNPHSLSDAEAREAQGLANTFGYSTEIGRKKDKANIWDIASGTVFGAIDSALLGILKNEWYENRRNRNYAKAGRIAGLIASIAAGGFMNPASLGKMGMQLGRIFGSAKAGKIMSTALQYGTTAGITGGIRQMGTAGYYALKNAPALASWKAKALGALNIAKGYAPLGLLGIGGLRALGQIGQSYSDVAYGNTYEEDLMAQDGLLPPMPAQ